MKAQYLHKQKKNKKTISVPIRAALSCLRIRNSVVRMWRRVWRCVLLRFSSNLGSKTIRFHFSEKKKKISFTASFHIHLSCFETEPWCTTSIIIFINTQFFGPLTSQTSQVTEQSDHFYAQRTFVHIVHSVGINLSEIWLAPWFSNV